MCIIEKGHKKRGLCINYVRVLMREYSSPAQALLLDTCDGAKEVPRKFLETSKKGVPRGFWGVLGGCFRIFQEPFKGVP